MICVICLRAPVDGFRTTCADCAAGIAPRGKMPTPRGPDLKFPPDVKFSVKPTEQKGSGVARAIDSMNAGYEPRIGSAKFQP